MDFTNCKIAVAKNITFNVFPCVNKELNKPSLHVPDFSKLMLFL